MPDEPVLSRPYAPGYGLPDSDPDASKVSWQDATRKLAEARNYWINTASPTGRPHAMPVWGVWFDGALIFGTGRSSRKGRHLAANSDVVVHLESGDDAVIIEGSVEEMTDTTLFAPYGDAFEAKYQIRPPMDDPENIFYRVNPRKAFTWTEAGFLETAARWTFP